MIQKFKHKGLKKLFESSSSAGINPQYVSRLRQILALLETAETLDDMDLPGLNLHELKGERKGTWSVKVSGNWRITFKLQKGDAFDVNYEDYH
ncbi:MAG: type II toxin-antitoxin system RelE/ParE family toxin [Deltaproteobacteria bacterium]|nr:type II toxin-antitoxin system RelE/ParE family toxin [Deltaproteobacteria bacterium]MBW2033518.1 type II toxin-antitoxin system RelE/ParE family toxin [Deltaproteobacteria bacterium]